MFITTLTYFLTFIIGPLIGGISQIAFLPISLPLIKIGFPKFFITFLAGVISAFIATWICSLIFEWLKISSGILMLLIIGLGFIINDLKRINSGRDAEMEFGYLVGDISGIILGGYFLII